MIVIHSLFLLTIYASSSIIANALSTVQSHTTWIKRSTAIFANPINSEGSKYRGDITEEEAFLWFDEAMVSCPRDHQVPPPTTIRTNPKTAQLLKSAKITVSLTTDKLLGFGFDSLFDVAHLDNRLLHCIERLCPERL